MLAADEDALICDFAQYYHILDFEEELPADRAAVLAYGLPEESRIKRLLSGSGYTIDQLLMAATYDRTAQLVYFKTKDALTGENRPPSVLSQMLGTEEKTDVAGFTSPEDFEAARQKILRKEG